MRVSEIARTVVSNVDEGFKATVKVSPKMFKVLFDLYGHKLKSICRELAANCHDAHVSVGLKQAFIAEVVESNDLDKTEPLLRFRDYGPGISKEAIKDVYMNFGESTKGDSNSEVGAFGLGAKSPWCYTEAYTVRSFQHGMVCTHAMYLDEKGHPRCALMSEELTEEPTGLEVLIPLKPEDVRQAWNILREMMVGYVLNGTENRPLDLSYEMPETLIDFAGVQVLNFSSSKVTILYGVTLYPLDNTVLLRLIESKGSRNLEDSLADFQSINESLTHSISVLVNVPLGVLDLVPSRESLSYDDRSLGVILGVLEAKAENYVRLFNETFSRFSNFHLCQIWKGSREIKHFFMRRAIADLNASTISSVDLSVMAADKNNQFKVERGGSSKNFVGFFSSRRDHNSKIVIKPIHVDNLQVKNDPVIYKAAMTANRVELSRLRRISNFAKIRFCLVSVEAAVWLEENNIKVTSVPELEVLDLESKTRRRELTSATRRNYKDLFSVTYGVDIRKSLSWSMVCTKQALSAEKRDLNVNRLDKTIQSGGRVLLFKMDYTGPLCPENPNLTRTRGGESFSAKFRTFMEELKAVNVIRNSDVFVFYASKEPPVDGVSAWDVLHGRWVSRKTSLEQKICQRAVQVASTQEADFAAFLRISGRSLPSGSTTMTESLRSKITNLTNRMNEMKEYCPIRERSYSWFIASLPYFRSLIEEAWGEYQEQVVKEYPMLRSVPFAYLHDWQKKDVKQYIEMVDSNRKGEVYAIPEIR